MNLIPYKLLARACPVVDDNVTVPKKFLDFLLTKLLAHVDFDEKGYFRVNPDVAAAVRKGEWGSGLEHFAAVGYFEDRRGGNLEVSEPWYAKVNPDVGRAVMAGEWPSGAAHYEQTGVYEWRSPNKDAAPDFLAWKELLHRPEVAEPKAEETPESKRAPAAASDEKAVKSVA